MHNAQETEIDIERVDIDESEMDEMWSYYHDKSHQIWLWHAIDHKTGVVLAFTFGTRKHEVLDELLNLLKPYNIHKVYADKNFAYQKKIGRDILESGKRNTQRIERKHLTLRTRVKRLARKTICFSKTEKMHKIVVGLLINVIDFELVI